MIRGVDMSVRLPLGEFWDGFSQEAAPAAPPPSPEIPQGTFLSFVPNSVHKYIDQLFELVGEVVLVGDTRMAFDEWRVRWGSRGTHPSADQLARLLAQLDLGVIAPSLQQEDRPDYEAIWASCHEVCCRAIGALLPDGSVEDFLYACSNGF